MPVLDEALDHRLIRLADIVQPNGMFPISKATWWAGVKAGRYPQPVKLGPRITAWRLRDLLKMLEHGAAG